MSHDAYSALSDATRRRILETLRGGPRPVGELVTELQVSQPTVSKHLKVLRDAGMVGTRAQGQKRFYSLTAQPLTEVVDWLETLVAAASTEQAEQPEQVQRETSAAPPVEPATQEPSERALPWFTAQVTEITETGESDVVVTAGEDPQEGPETDDTARESAEPDEVEKPGGETGSGADEQSPEQEMEPVREASQVTGDTLGADVHAAPGAQPEAEDDAEPRDVAPSTAPAETLTSENAEQLRPRGGAHRRQSGLLSTLTGLRRRGRGARRD